MSTEGLTIEYAAVLLGGCTRSTSLVLIPTQWSIADVGHERGKHLHEGLGRHGPEVKVYVVTRVALHLQRIDGGTLNLLGSISFLLLACANTLRDTGARLLRRQVIGRCAVELDAETAKVAALEHVRQLRLHHGRLFRHVEAR